MSKNARISQHAMQSQWSGPTHRDVLNASGRRNSIIRFVRTGRGPHMELLIQVGQAFTGNDNKIVVFTGRTVDGKYTIKGVLDGTARGPALATIERTPFKWVGRRAS